ncbi:hypothetical protein ABBQ38_005543 [Trebouxia sp. C0009 RCD-2024]
MISSIYNDVSLIFLFALRLSSVFCANAQDCQGTAIGVSGKLRCWRIAFYPRLSSQHVSCSWACGLASAHQKEMLSGCLAITPHPRCGIALGKVVRHPRPVALSQQLHRRAASS